MPNSFGNDGAFGAGGAGMTTAPAPGTPFGAKPSGSSSAPAPMTDMNYAAAGSGGGSGFIPQEIPSEPAAPSASPQAVPTSPLTKPSYQTGNAPGGAQGSNVPTSAGGIFFDAGGSVPDDNGQSQQQDPMAATMQRSMGSVSQTIQAMYQQYGLGGDQSQQGGVQDDAANMPTAPAGQSETGIPPKQPGPGTLPPTSKPFGQRVAGAMPAIPGEGRGGGWDVPPLKPQGPGTQPSTPAPGTWKPPPRPGGARTADAGGIQDDEQQESA
jgi:hypothetical protein